MSGICGLFNLDQSPVADRDLRAMCAMLKIRGPEATNTWCDGAIGFGHTLLATTPELVAERQPFTHTPSGCVITADLRLDNRDELLHALAPAQQPATIGDAELVLLAYLAWDEDCLARLLGDFAFAIWDPRQQRLFCGRDHFGMRPFYYHHAPQRHFLFGSSARCVAVPEQVPYVINERRVADFLVPELEWVDYTSTFFEGIHRLPPAHQAIVTRSGVTVAEYWQPEPETEPGLLSDDDYRQGFLEVFTQSVADRLRVPNGTVGSMLSGGMDSGSIVAVARENLGNRGDGPLPTFSAVSGQYDRSTPIDCAESRAIHASIEMPGIQPTLICPQSMTQRAEFLISGYEEPFDTDFMFLRALFGAANEQGLRVLLDGGGGDIVLSEGSYIMRLIRQGSWSRAMTEIAGENRFHDGNRLSLLWNLSYYLRAALVPDAVKQSVQGIRNRQQDQNRLDASLIAADFAKHIDVASRFAEHRRTFSRNRHLTFELERVRAICPNVTAGRERYARIAALLGMEARDPFLDKRVVDFSAGLPGHLRMRNGMAKIILRDLMSDRVPYEVAWEGRKPHVGWLFNQAVNRSLLQNGALSLGGLQDQLRGYVDVAALRAAWQSFHNSGFNENVNKALYLSTWLRENSERPVVPNYEIL